MEVFLTTTVQNRICKNYSWFEFKPCQAVKTWQNLPQNLTGSDRGWMEGLKNRLLYLEVLHQLLWPSGPAQQRNRTPTVGHTLWKNYSNLGQSMQRNHVRLSSPHHHCMVQMFQHHFRRMSAEHSSTYHFWPRQIVRIGQGCLHSGRVLEPKDSRWFKASEIENWTWSQ